METTQQKIKKAIPVLTKQFGFKSISAAPKIVKVVVSSGTGKAKDKKRNELVADRLAKITGQKPTARQAKQSIASFKLRQGEVIGFAATLRGKRMYDFLDKMINIAFPRTRDFKGIDPKCIDEIGNMTIGIKEQSIFPETADEEIRDLFGFSVTIVTTAKTRDHALEFFKALGFPFKKTQIAK